MRFPESNTCDRPTHPTVLNSTHLFWDMCVCLSMCVCQLNHVHSLTRMWGDRAGTCTCRAVGGNRHPRTSRPT